MLHINENNSSELTLVVPGLSGGLGTAMLPHLAEMGRVVGSYYRNRPKQGPDGVEFLPLDVRSENSVETFIADAVSTAGEKIVLLNMAGISINAMGHKMDPADWSAVVGVNLTGTFLTCRYLLPVLRARGWGRVINLASVVGQRGVPGTSAYAASKAGIFGLTRALAAENGPKGVTVNALALGYFEAGLIAQIPDQYRQWLISETPLGRLGNPHELAGVVRFLIETEFVTGQVINVNGGLL